MKTVMRIFVISTIVALASGCSGMIPMYSVDGRSIERDLSEEEVEKAIKIGAATAGWRTQSVTSGHLLATYNIRAHTVIVDINYATRSYSIDYKSSLEMKIHCTEADFLAHRAVQVTPEDDCPEGHQPAYIHENYKEWVDGLDRAITGAINAV